MLLLAWSLLEVGFYLYLYHKEKHFQKYTRPVKVPTAEERKTLYWNCCHTIGHNVKRWFVGWFYIIESPTRESPDFNEIRRENVATWFAWAFWVESLDVVRKNDAWAIELEWMISSFEVQFNVKFTEGYNDRIRCIRPNFDPVQSLHRPLFMYLGNYGLTLLFNRLFLGRFWKFEQRGTDTPGVMFGHLLRPFYRPPSPQSIITTGKKERLFKHLVYWYRPGNSESSNSTTGTDVCTPSPPPTTPIVFVHGIGGGLTFYAEFIYQLVQSSGRRPIFCVELPYVSMRLVDHIPTPEETVAEIVLMLDTHGYQEAIIVAHSLGTAVASWMANQAPKHVGGMVLVDPICFLLNYHHVAFSMLCRIPQSVKEHLIQYFVSRELFTNYYISRHFQWYQTILFAPAANDDGSRLGPAQDGPLRNTTVYLSEKDLIVDSCHIAKYLDDSGVRTRLMENIGHAEFLACGSWKSEILSQIEKTACALDDKGLSF